MDNDMRRLAVCGWGRGSEHMTELSLGGIVEGKESMNQTTHRRRAVDEDMKDMAGWMDIWACPASSPAAKNGNWYSWHD